jgi:uncharacterized membrane protein YdjX (TVP38/TMEM64 family)
MNKNQYMTILVVIIMLGLIIYDALYYQDIHGGERDLKSLLFPLMILTLLILKKKSIKEKEKWQEAKKEEKKEENQII